MVAISIKNFGGEIPAVDDRLLPDNAAASATNTWLFSGRIEPMRAHVELYTPVNPATRSWFRLPKGDPGLDYMSSSYWVEFENQNVRVIESPVAGQSSGGRYYWADGVAPKYMTGAMIAAGDTPYVLGIPQPATPPAVVPSGGVSITNKTVAYVYTWVSGLGEEGPPSDPTTVTGKIDDTYQITVTAPTLDDTTNRDLQKTRIYRTVTSQQGVAVYYFVTELPIATLVYDDSDPDSTVINNEQLPSTYWFAPPEDLQGFVSMPNGMVAGWRENEVWFCEPYYPHAWPVLYVRAVPSTIVGLGVFNQSLVVLTQGQPYALTGTDPQNMSSAEIQPLEPCTSRNSIVNTPAGVLYSSPNGLIQITPQGAVNLTLATITKEQWYAALNLQSIAAGILSLGYYAHSLQVPGVFQDNAFQADAFQQASHFGTLPGVYQKLDNPRMGLMRLDPQPDEVQNVITDLFNGELMEMHDGVIYVVDTRQAQPVGSAEGSYVWRSKIFEVNYPRNLAAAKVYWVAPTDEERSAVFKIYAGNLVDEAEDGLQLRGQVVLRKSGSLFRLPSGFKALFWQFEIVGNVTITAVHVASTARELRAI